MLELLLQGDALSVLRTLPAEIAQTCVTSPPYWGLRDYGAEGQLGLEATPEAYVAKLVEIFREVRRVLRDDGTLWLNLGDSYAARGNGGGGSFMEARGHTAWAQSARLKGFRKAPSGLKAKDLVGIPWMVAFALRADGWYLRSDIIWSKLNPMPESVRDRPTKSHEYIFLLAKSGRPTVWRARDTGEWSRLPDLQERIAIDGELEPRWSGHDYFYDADAIKEPAKTTGRPSKPRGSFTTKGEPLPGRAPFRAVVDYRNKRSVWRVPTQPFKGAHFAVYPPKLIRPCVLAGSGIGDLVIDPFNGAGTTGLVAIELRRRYLGIEINPEYIELTRKRLAEVQLEMFA